MHFILIVNLVSVLLFASMEILNLLVANPKAISNVNLSTQHKILLSRGYEPFMSMTHIYILKWKILNIATFFLNL